MKLTEKLLNESRTRIKASSVHADNLQHFISTIETHLSALDTVSKVLKDDEAKNMIVNVRRELVKSLELRGIDIK